MNVAYTPQAIEDIAYWRSTDRRKYDRIRRLIAAVADDPFEGIGKPERLKGDLAGKWSRRIDQEHRLVYEIVGALEVTVVVILAARCHYQR